MTFEHVYVEKRAWAEGRGGFGEVEDKLCGELEELWAGPPPDLPR